MPQRVVDMLEPVEIDQHQRRRHPVGGSLGERRQVTFELRPVGQPGQRVVVGEKVDMRLGAPPLGDVARTAHQPDDLAFGIAQRQLRGREPQLGAVGAHHILLVVDQRPAAADDPHVILVIASRQLGRMHVEVGFADQRIGVAMPQIGRHRAVGNDETGVPVLDVEIIRHLVDHGAQPAALDLGAGLFAGQFSGEALQPFVGSHQRRERFRRLGASNVLDGRPLHNHQAL